MPTDDTSTHATRPVPAISTSTRRLKLDPKLSDGQHWVVAKTCADGCEFYYRAAMNEAGWSCLRCKISGLLHDLHDGKFVSVSNEGEGIIASVASTCRKSGRYDQATIIAAIIAASGADKRERCSGGHLADAYHSRSGGWIGTCSVAGCSCGGLLGGGLS